MGLARIRLLHLGNTAQPHLVERDDIGIGRIDHQAIGQVLSMPLAEQRERHEINVPGWTLLLTGLGVMGHTEKAPPKRGHWS
jgi:hypothetical protein